MKKVVITGGLGYIGMELCKVYSGVSRNYEIKVIDTIINVANENRRKREKF